MQVPSQRSGSPAPVPAARRPVRTTAVPRGAVVALALALLVLAAAVLGPGTSVADVVPPPSAVLPG